MGIETFWALYKKHFRKYITEAKVNNKEYNIKSILRQYETKISKETIIMCAYNGWNTLFKDSR